jgi:hypothetical protein
MASRQGQYKRIDHPTQLRAVQFLIERGYGPPPQTIEIQRDDGTITLVKRVIGVSDSDI